MLKNAIRIAFFGPQGVLDSAKLGQVAPKLAQVGPTLGSSWHLGAMLRSSCRHLAVLTRLVAVLARSWGALGAILAHLGASWGRLGAIFEPSWGLLGPS